MEVLQSVFTAVNNRVKVEQQVLWLRSVIKQWLCGATDLWITDGVTRFPFHSSSHNRIWMQVSALAAGVERRSAATPNSPCPSRTFGLTQGVAALCPYRASLPRITSNRLMHTPPSSLLCALGQIHRSCQGQLKVHCTRSLTCSGGAGRVYVAARSLRGIHACACNVHDFPSD